LDGGGKICQVTGLNRTARPSVRGAQKIRDEPGSLLLRPCPIYNNRAGESQHGQAETGKK
jgi:hypothetical protein